MVDGKKVTLGGKEFVVPPATLADQEKTLALWRTLEASTKENTRFSDAHIPFVAETIRVLLRRNYPELTIDEIKDLLPSRRSGWHAAMRAVEIAAELADEEGEAKGEAGSP